jgi:hypothetical protein
MCRIPERNLWLGKEVPEIEEYLCTLGLVHSPDSLRLGHSAHRFESERHRAHPHQPQKVPVGRTGFECSEKQ